MAGTAACRSKKSPPKPPKVAKRGPGVAQLEKILREKSISDDDTEANRTDRIPSQGNPNSSYYQFLSSNSPSCPLSTLHPPPLRLPTLPNSVHYSVRMQPSPPLLTHHGDANDLTGVGCKGDRLTTLPEKAIPITSSDFKINANVAEESRPTICFHYHIPRESLSSGHLLPGRLHSRSWRPHHIPDFASSSSLQPQPCKRTWDEVRPGTEIEARKRPRTYSEAKFSYSYALKDNRAAALQHSSSLQKCGPDEETISRAPQSNGQGGSDNNKSCCEPKIQSNETSIDLQSERERATGDGIDLTLKL